MQRVVFFTLEAVAPRRSLSCPTQQCVGAVRSGRLSKQETCMGL